MMDLTSSSFQILMIVATLVVTVGTCLLWNRVRGPRPIRWLSRFGLLGTSYALAAVAALVSINIAYGGLISGWAELWDNLKSTGGTSTQAGGITGGMSGSGQPGPGGVRPSGTPPTGAPRGGQAAPK